MIDKNKEFIIHNYIDESGICENEENNFNENSDDNEDEHFEWWLRYGNN